MAGLLTPLDVDRLVGNIDTLTEELDILWYSSTELLGITKSALDELRRLPIPTPKKEATGGFQPSDFTEAFSSIHP